MAIGWKASLTGLFVTGLCLAGAVGSKSREESFRRQELDRDTRIVTRQAATRIMATLDRHRVALQQMANFYENSQEVTWDEFLHFARLTQDLSPLLVRISFINPDWHVGATYPRTFQASLNQLDVREHPDCFRTMRRAQEGRKAVVSTALTLPDGTPGFIMAVPVFKESGFQGEVVGAFRNDAFFEGALFPELLQRYDVKIFNSGKLIFEPDRGSPIADDMRPIIEKFSLGGIAWETRLQPREAVVRASLGTGQAIFWILASLLALAAGGIAVVLARWTAQVATRLRTQGETLRETREQLEEAMGHLQQAEKMKAMGELVAGVAHEINNPLASIMGYTQLLQARNLPDDVRRRLELVHTEAERMARIVKNLLTFARKHPPEKKFLGLNGIIEKTLELKAYAFRIARVRVEKDLSPHLPRTMLDFTQIQQVFLNLLSNAEQAMVEQTEERILRIETREANGRITVEVSDTGPGVPPQHRSRIFEPFYTTKKEGRGTGLGLSLCYGIVQEHQGTIRLECRPGMGATFVIELPALEPPGVEEALSGRSFRPEGSLDILVIDPEPGLVRFLVDLLSSRGHRVDTASDMAEALRKLRSNGHDLIISDVKIPQGTGSMILEAAAEKDPELARRVIFTSGEGSSEEVQRLTRELGNPVILKPFRIEDVDRAIAGVLRN